MRVATNIAGVVGCGGLHVVQVPRDKVAPLSNGLRNIPHVWNMPNPNIRVIARNSRVEATLESLCGVHCPNARVLRGQRNWRGLGTKVIAVVIFYRVLLNCPQTKNLLAQLG